MMKWMKRKNILYSYYSLVSILLLFIIIVIIYSIVVVVYHTHKLIRNINLSIIIHNDKKNRLLLLLLFNHIILITMLRLSIYFILLACSFCILYIGRGTGGGFIFAFLNLISMLLTLQAMWLFDLQPYI